MPVLQHWNWITDYYGPKTHKIVVTTILTGKYKQWNGLLEWNTGLDYWNKLFSFFGQVFEFIFGSLYFLKFTSNWLLWMIVIMTIVGYHSVIITKCKYTLDNALYCKLSEVETFCGFLVNWLATTNFSSIIIIIASNNTYAK